jgi:hypothetical protein
VRDLFSLLDRGLLFRQVELYFKETNSSLAAMSHAMVQWQASGQQIGHLLATFRQLHSDMVSPGLITI